MRRKKGKVKEREAGLWGGRRGKMSRQKTDDKKEQEEATGCGI